MAFKKKNSIVIDSSAQTDESRTIMQDIGSTDIAVPDGRLGKTLRETPALRMRNIPYDELMDNDENTFTVDENRLNILEMSIRDFGVLQPLLVERRKGGYVIRAGSRRYASVTHIRAESEKAEDRATLDRFVTLPCIVLPGGMTEEEKKRVIAETNLATRSLSHRDLFRNFSIIFAKDENGRYKYIGRGENKLNFGIDMLKELGFDYKGTSVKEYLKIYEAHNPEIRKAVADDLMDRRTAVFIARLEDDEQDMVMNLFTEMKDDHLEEFNDMVEEMKQKTGPKRRRKKRNAPARAVNIRKTVRAARDRLEAFGSADEYLYTPKLDSRALISSLGELREAIDRFEKSIIASEDNREKKQKEEA